MNNEIWKPIKNYEGLYEVSNLGNVRSLDRVVVDKRGCVKPFKGVVLKTGLVGIGYMCVTLCKNGNEVSKKIHHLVFDTFVGDNRDGLQIDHINENKLDNRVDNLQLLTNRENTSKGCRYKYKSSKYTGVSKYYNKWRSQIYKNGSRKHLGYFNCETAASIAYQRELNLLTGKE